MFEFTSEPGIVISGTEFKLVQRQRLDENGDSVLSARAIGRDGNSCGLFFVPPSEQARLESLGAVFTIETVESW